MSSSNVLVTFAKLRRERDLALKKEDDAAWDRSVWNVGFLTIRGTSIESRDSATVKKNIFYPLVISRLPNKTL